MSNEQVMRIYQNLVDEDLVENFAEYDKLMLIGAFGLDDYHANSLFLMLQGATNVEYNHMHTGLVEFDTAIQEALHQNFDGWSEGDKAVIYAFLADMCFAANQDL